MFKYVIVKKLFVNLNYKEICFEIIVKDDGVGFNLFVVKINLGL